MFGRYRLSKRKQLIEGSFETANEVDWEPRYNIAPLPPLAGAMGMANRSFIGADLILRRFWVNL